MTKTTIRYSWPVGKKNVVRMTYDESPAHVGPLINSVDFIVPLGTPVKAAAPGLVIEIKDDSRVGGASKDFEPDGNYIEIQHSRGEYSEYEHLQQNSARVKVGERIRAGQIIALSGATGWIADLGPHLHFMVGKYGNTVKDYQTLEIVWKK